MKQLVIMPGGFHPFHAGHLALYQAAQKAFPGADVKVAATNDTSQRPFPFAIKEKLAQLAGVAPGDFYQVKSPFQAKEITQHYNPEDTELIFVRSEKDANKPPQAGGIKKDGNPAYLQPLKGQDVLYPMNRHAYMAYLPTVEFGPGMTSATEIRTAWPTLNDKRKTALVMSLYPKTQNNPKLAQTVVKMLDTAMDDKLEESGINPKRIDVFYRPVANSRARRVVARNIPAIVLDQLLDKLSKKFAVPVSSFEWTAADKDIDENQGWAATLEAKSNKCPPATQDITLNLKNRQKAIDEYGYGPLNPDLPNTKFWMAKVDEWNLDSMEEAQQSLCGNCAAFDQRKDTLDCIAQGIDSDSPDDAAGVIDAGDLGYCKFLKFKCASRRTCDAWVTGGPLVDKPTLEGSSQSNTGGMWAGYQQRENQPVAEDYVEEKWSQKYKKSINCANPKGFSQRAHCAGRKK